MHSRRTRILVTLAACLLVALSVLRPFDRASEAYLDTAMRNALVTFAVARVLNAGISVVQATDVSFSPAGIGVTVAPGEVLDPLNDLIEQFSWVMLVAASSVGIQKLLLAIGGSLQFSVLITAALALYLLALWHPGLRRSRFMRFAYVAAAVLVALRFSMAIVLLGNEMVYRQFLEHDYREASAGLDIAKEKIESLSAEREAAQSEVVPGGESGFSDRMRGLWNGAAEKLNPARHLEALKTAASEATDHVIRLIVVFVLQTVLLPLLFLWGLYRTVAGFIGVRGGI